MYLAKLQIKGFKSFARKTELVFNDGITAIVGPNGCGKTNIIDAIRWVLGEQKPGVLRGERMDNVIFSGTQRVKPQAMAEVSLTIQNTRGVLPVEYSEVVVTRRLYRSGESEYLLNKTPCRLKDVQDLFMDTGMGPDSYSVIELKMIESILSNNAEERLRLFEEAAGINKYKQHRRATIKKLEATEVDLNRVNDIIAEVEHNVNSLKRQVSKAERYKKLTMEIEALDIRIASLEYTNILKELQPLKKQLDQKEKDWQANRTELSREEATVEKLKAEILTLEEHLSNLRREIEQVMELIHNKENDIAVNQERQRSFNEKVDRYQKEKVQAKKRQEILTTHLQQSRPKLVSLQEKLDSLKMKFRLKSQELDEAEKVLVRRRLEVNNSRLQLIELLKEIGEGEKKRNHLESQIVHLKGRKRQLGDENARLSEGIQTLQQELKKRHEEEVKLNQEVENLRQLCEQKQQELEQEHQTGEVLRERILNVRNALDALERQRSFLQNLIELKGGYTESTRLLAQHQSEFEGLLGLFGDLISAPKAYRPAIEAIAGDIAQYFIVEKMEQMPPILDFLQQHHSGQVTFLILERIPTSETTETPLIEVPGVIGLASAFVKADQRLQPLVRFVFGEYLIVKNQDVLRNLTGDSSLNVVTLEGEVFTRTGILRSGWYDTGRRLSQIGKNEQLQEIELEMQSLHQKLKDMEEEKKNHQEKLLHITTELENFQKQLKEKEAIYLQQRIEAAQKQTALDKSRENLDSNQKEMSAIEDQIANSQQTLTQLKPQLDELIQRRRRHEAEVQPLQDKLEELENQRNRLADEVHQLNLNVVRTTAEYHNLQQEIQRLERTVSDLERTINSQAREIEEAKQEIQRLSEMLATDEKALTELHERHKLLQSQQQQRQKNHNALRERLQKRETILKETRRAGDSSADFLRTFKVRITELEAQATHLRDKIKEKYGVEITSVEAKETEDLSVLRQDLEKLQQRLRTFGPVNLLAVEDYQKESERLSFLQKQREDLVEAKSTLMETISIINKTAREKFENVFEQIRSNFRTNFQIFFEGGEGDLQIRFNPEDPLEAEISILVRPKGKELGSLALLSSGEKALTAIALLFSIYQVKPSPFCVLDEVDAPLDDANLQRFLKVIRNFVSNVQFIIVTHNKVTMSEADYLYGVTMEEEGISKVVSVKLESDEIDKYVESSRGE